MRIKTILTAAAVTLLAAVSCTKEHESRLDDLESRVTALEQIAEASKNGDVITSVTPITENSELIGYRIEFQKADPINVYLGKNGDSVFQSVTVSDTEVTFITTDGQTLVIRRALALSIEFDTTDLVVMGTNDTRDIHYTITSGEDDDITIEALSSADIKVTVVKNDAKTGTLNVKTGPSIDEYSKVVVLVSNGSQAIMRTLTFEEESIEVEENSTKNVTGEGGEVTLEFFSNTTCHVVIPEDAQSWISIAPETKAMTKQAITLTVQHNNGAARSAIVSIRSEENTLTLYYTVNQEAGFEYQYLVEKEALIAIYQSLNGDNWTHNDNWCSDMPIGSWYGVTTDSNGFVRLINLPDNNLKGSFPEQLWDLIHLQGLCLPDNHITGVFPQVSNNKCELCSMDLSRNQLTGGLSVLKELKNLSVIYLNENRFSGQIPIELTEIQNLEILYLWMNSLQGQIPAEFGNCKKLRELLLCFNYLSGEIPEAIGNAPELKSFIINNNCFTGKYPQWLLDNDRFYGDWLLNIEGNLFDLSDSEIPGPVFDVVDLDGNHITSDIYSKNRYTILFRTAADLYLSEMKFAYENYHNSGVEIIGLYDGWDMPNEVYDAGEAARIQFATDQAKQHKIDNNIPWTCCIGRPIFFNPEITIIDDKGCIVYYLYSFGYPEDVPLSEFWPKWNLFLKLLDKEPDTKYSSIDYSHDGEVTQLQASTKGQGIDLVLMGDGFSDRLIEDGTYEAIMQRAAESLFIEEPYKSYKDLFNVYYVTAVSKNEEFGQDDETIFESTINNEYISANNGRIVSYANMAIPDDRIDDATVLVIVNQDKYAGTCYMYHYGGNYGKGLSIGLIPAVIDDDTFIGLVSHEICGHGFAKLADEYGYEANGQYEPYSGFITTRSIDELIECGWYKNIDFTSDPSSVKWSQFISDARYADEHIGCYEGAFTYWTGVWRPTENSIMRYNTGGFNAPSRYAIWYRIGKLAYGESWEGSYEDFVAYDAVNRTPAAVQKRQAQIRRQRLSKPLPPLPAPVVVGHSWREELQKGK